MANKITKKQAKALSLIQDGVLPTVAMKQAGYSELTSQAPSRNLLSSPAVQSVIEDYKEKYLEQGITTNYMAEKTKEWLEATKPIAARILVTKDGKVQDAEAEGAIEVPDYQTQIKAAEFVRRDLGLGQQSNVSKRIVAEEFFRE